ncbi:MAG: family 10 glycosylhydrolase [Clostridia bacterium]|nr:family 10 glycosylhydrolase [Clostridia bacterium]
MSVLGVWMWPQSVRIHGAQRVAARCSRAGITDICFLTKGLAGTTSHLSRIAPHCCERDLLRELIDAAHPLGIRVHAWLTSASDEHYKLLHPHSGRCHYTRGKDKGLISLTDAGYQAYMQNVIAELCREYEIDGLHLDYIRYNHLLYGWAEEDVSRYAAAGADPARLRRLMDDTFLGDAPDALRIFDAFRAGDASALALARARRADVTGFASALIAPARAAKEDLIISAALMPEGAYDDTAFSDLHYGQNYDDAAALYDCALPMAYSKAYEKDSSWVRAVADGTLRRGLRTIMGLHAYEGGTGPSLQEDADALCGAAVDGICLFREGAFAMAFSTGRELCLCNTLDAPITAIRADESDSLITPANPILPGTEARVALPHVPHTLRIYTDKAEACVWLTRR